MGAGVVSDLRCRRCGERLISSRWRGGLTHVARLAAACELDGDHPPEPDWAAVAPLACRRCGASLRAHGVTLDHADGPPADGHEPEVLAV